MVGNDALLCGSRDCMLLLAVSVYTMRAWHDGGDTWTGAWSFTCGEWMRCVWLGGGHVWIVRGALAALCLVHAVVVVSVRERDV